MMQRAFLFLLTPLVAAAAPRTPAPLTRTGALVTFTGTRMGQIEGPYKGKSFGARSFREVTSQRSGYRSFEMTFGWNSAAILLLSALSNNESMRSVDVEFVAEVPPNGHQAGGPPPDSVIGMLNLIGSNIVGMTAALGRPRISSGTVTSQVIVTIAVPAANVRYAAAAIHSQGGSPNAPLHVATVQPPIPTVVEALAPASYPTEQTNGRVYDVTFADINVTPTLGTFHDEIPSHPPVTAQLDSVVFAVNRSASGALAYQPLVFTKLAGSSTQDFQQAQTTGSVLRTVSLVFKTTDAAGHASDLMRLDLAGAKVGSDQVVTVTGNTPQHANGALVETITVTAQSFTLASTQGGQMAHDNWTVSP